jgi:hypothetical protein
MKLSLTVLLVACCALSACASHSHHRRVPESGRPREWHPSRDLLTRYDANHDGTLTKAELEAGIKADFDAADHNHDGCLDADEIRAVNEKRLQEQGSTATPLIDWHQDGCVDIDEFGGTTRSLFIQMDRDGDGKLDPKEINPNAPAAKKKGQGQNSSGSRRHRGGGSQPGDGSY